MRPRNRVTRAGIHAVALGSLLVAGFAIAQQGAPAGQVQKRVMWWNDSAWAVRLQLTEQKRTQMDEAESRHRPKADEVKPARLRQAFYKRLASGDFKAAETDLKAWADAEQRSVKLQGDLKVGVLSLLSPAQLKTFFESGGARIARGPWKPRLRWPLNFKQLSE